jgi:hypothetical protein
MNSFLSIHWFIIVGIWYSVNGILHDIFVIKGHKGSYDRELLRLLMDGHVLILSGIICIICWYLAKENVTYAAIIGLIIAVGMIIYCAMIFPFLKSFVTLVLSMMLVIVCINAWLHSRIG